MREMRQAYLEYLYRKEKKMQTHTHTPDFIEKNLRKEKKKRKKDLFSREIYLTF